MYGHSQMVTGDITPLGEAAEESNKANPSDLYKHKQPLFKRDLSLPKYPLLSPSFHGKHNSQGRIGYSWTKSTGLCSVIPGVSLFLIYTVLSGNCNPKPDMGVDVLEGALFRIDRCVYH